jgi:polynucleotide 5'-kinase involved in rRNA processing
MVIGAVDSGKSHLARYLLARAGRRRAALVSADVGQPSLGVPACVAMAVVRPWRVPAAMWFVGDVTPVRNLLPNVIGTARLVERARAAGAALVVVDTGGLVEGPLGRLLKYHKAVAARATDVVALQQANELEPLLALLDGIVRVHRVAPAQAARQRSREERRDYRERRFRAHLRAATTLRLGTRRLLTPDWAPGPGVPPLPGTLVGLLDRDGFCLRLGIMRATHGRTVEVAARWRRPREVAWLRLGTLRVAPSGVELR